MNRKPSADLDTIIDDVTHKWLAFFTPRKGYVCKPNVKNMCLELIEEFKKTLPNSGDETTK